jgi:alpha-galactosidase
VGAGRKIITTTVMLFAALALRAADSRSAFLDWAPTPPMGWNSWDCFATTVTEAQTKAHADIMAEKLAAHGYTIVTVDIQWYEPDASSFNYRKGAKLAMDEHGRLLPAVNRFPSAAAGAGFKLLAEYVHAKGLKFGIHLMRGIPRQAVEENTPILGATQHAADIADHVHVCKWNTDMFGVDMAKPGAQAYYDSVFALIASWGVDFMKVDDLSPPYGQNTPEVEAIRRAIDRTGRAMVLSLSPGETPVAQGAHVSAHANMWRISDDFWDKWPLLLSQFERLRKWAPFAGPGHWPDADMLPIGTLEMGRRQTRFTPDEQRTMLTLWCIARSPLILGADLTKLDDATFALVTNDEVLAVDQHSTNNHQLFARDGFIAWCADVPGSPDKYLAIFNTNDQPKPDGAAFEGGGASVAIPLALLGLDGTCFVRDLWRRENVGNATGDFTPGIVCHGVALFRFSPERK